MIFIRNFYSIPTVKFTVLLLIITEFSWVYGYNILGVLHFPSRSHFIFGSALLKGLTAEGHDITVITSFPQKQPLRNYHDVPLHKVLPLIQEKTSNILDSTTKGNVLLNVFSYFQVGLDITEAVLKETSVQELLASNKTFDAVICEVMLGDALYGLSEHFQAPLIGLGTFGAIAWNTDLVGSPSPPSYVPYTLLPFSDHMSFVERFINFLAIAGERLIMDLYFLPRQAELLRKYFPHVRTNLEDIRRRTSLVLLNTHFSLAFSRPYVSNQIEVGGLHISPQDSPLPKDLADFINGAEHGVVYFSMGTAIQSRKMPMEIRQQILKALRSLKQRVLWKFEDTSLPNKPDNVLIREWFPQSDILAHSNVKVFITHGGILSTTESIYHGKPLVGIPIFGDQSLNMAKAVRNGYAIKLSYKNLTANDLQNAIERIIADDSFTENARRISALYRDQPMKPLDKAIYWIEYVIRHKGAQHMHCSGLDLNFWQYHNIDIIMLLIGGFLILLGLTMKILSIICCSVSRRSRHLSTKKLKMK